MTRFPFPRLLRLSLPCFTLAGIAVATGVLASAHDLAAAPAMTSAAASAATAPSKSSRETALHRIQRAVAKIDAEAATPEGEEAVLQRLSAQLGVSADSLKLQHGTWGLGYGEMAMAYGFAKASRKGKTPADVVAMRVAGVGWLDIAKELGVKVDAVASRMRRHVAPASPR